MIRRLPIFLLLGACASPLGGEDVDLGVGASGLPGYGVTVTLAQRMKETERRRLDLELALTHQELNEDPNDPGVKNNGWNQVQLGLLWKLDPGASRHWLVRTGIVWVRAQGDPIFLDESADYGGAYAGFGYLWDTGPHLSTGPDLSLLLVDGEGAPSGGVIPQIAWRLVWHL